MSFSFVAKGLSFLGLFLGTNVMASMVLFPPVQEGASLAALRSLTPLPSPETLPPSERARTLDPHASDPDRLGLPIALDGVVGLQGWINASVNGSGCKILRSVDDWEPLGGSSVGAVCEGLPEGRSNALADVEVWVETSGGIVSFSEPLGVKFDNLLDPIVSMSTKFGADASNTVQLASGVEFGSSIAWVGDIDGDGNPAEVIIGAPSDNTGGGMRGAFYTLSLDSETSGTILSKVASGAEGCPTLQDGDHFGASLCAIGDVNGDGRATDIVVGAYGDDTGGSDRGAIYIMTLASDGTAYVLNMIGSGVGGGPVLKNGDHFGVALAWVGDIDGDGQFSDIVVGAMSDGSSLEESGAVFVFSLGINGAATVFSVISSEVAGGPSLSAFDMFGTSLAFVDVFCCDIIVGASGDDTGGTDRGAVYLLSIGSNGEPAVENHIASGVGGGPTLEDESFFGSSVARIGDILENAAFYFAVSAPGKDTNTGALYLLGFISDGSVVSSVMVSSSSRGGPPVNGFDRFGSSIAWVGDVARNGRPSSIMVGAPGDSESRGAVYLLSLSDQSDIDSRSRIEGVGLPLHEIPQPSSFAAAVMVPSGPRFFLPQLDPHATDPSRSILPISILTTSFEASATVEVLNVSIDAIPCQSTNALSAWPLVSNSRRLGIACIGPPEGVNGKLVDVSVWVRDTRSNLLEKIVGEKVVRYDDRQSSLVNHSVTISSATTEGLETSDGDYFGVSVTWIGDVDGNGRATNIAVGASGDDTGGSNCGAVYILSVAVDGSATVLRKIASQYSGGPLLREYDSFGISLAWVGDVDGDGMGSDILIGANGDDARGENAGAIYVASLGSDGVATVLNKIAPESRSDNPLSAGAQFGLYCATLGSVEGSGTRVEFVVSAFQDDGMKVFYVMSLLHDGSALLRKILTSAVRVNSPISQLVDASMLSASVAPIGDISGCGFSIGLVVGAHLDSTEGANRGATHLLLLSDITDKLSRSDISGASHPLPRNASLTSQMPLISSSSPSFALPVLDPTSSDDSRRILPLSVLTSTFNASSLVSVLNASIDAKSCRDAYIIPSWPQSPNSRRIGVACIDPPPGEPGKLVFASVSLQVLSSDGQESVVATETITSSAEIAKYGASWIAPVNATLLVSPSGGPPSALTSMEYASGSSRDILSSSSSTTNLLLHPSLESLSAPTEVSPTSGFGAALARVRSSKFVVGAPNSREIFHISLDEGSSLSFISSLSSSTPLFGQSIAAIGVDLVAVGAQNEVFLVTTSSSLAIVQTIPAPITAVGFGRFVSLVGNTNGTGTNLLVGGSDFFWICETTDGSVIAEVSAADVGGYSIGANAAWVGDLNGDGIATDFLLSTEEDGVLILASLAGKDVVVRSILGRDHGGVEYVFQGGIAWLHDFNGDGLANEVACGYENGVLVVGFGDLSADSSIIRRPTIATMYINAPHLSPNSQEISIVPTNVSSVVLVSPSSGGIAVPGSSIQLSVRLPTSQPSSISAVFLGSNAPCLFPSFMERGGFPSASSTNSKLVGIQCGGLIVWKDETEQGVEVILEGGRVEFTDGSVAITSAPSFASIDAALATSPSLFPVPILELDLLQKEYISLDLSNIFCMDNEGVSLEPGGISLLSASSTKLSKGWGNLAQCTHFNATVAACKAGFWSKQRLVSIGAPIPASMRVNVTVPQLFSVRCVENCSSNGTLNFAGGNLLSISGTGFGVSNVSQPLHDCYSAWVTEGMQHMTNWKMAANSEIGNIMFWVFVGSRPCLHAYWVSESELQCVSPGGMTKYADVVIVLAGESYRLRDAVIFDVPSVGAVSPLGPLSLYSASNISISGGIVDFIGRSMLPSGVFFEGDIRVGPWKVTPSSLVPSLVGNSSSFSFVDVSVPPGAGANLEVVICFRDSSGNSPAGVSFRSTQTPCSPRKEGVACFFTSPEIANPSPSTGILPFGGVPMSLSAVNIGPISTLQQVSPTSIQIFMAEVQVLDLSFKEISQNEVVLSFASPPAAVTSATIVMNVLGSLSNSVSVSYTQIYVIACSPQEVIPSADGALLYDFVVSAIGLEEGVEAVWIGGVRCPNFRMGSGTKIFCRGLPAPPIWTSEAVWVVAPNGESPQQHWLDLQPPPRLLAIRSPESGFPISGVANVTIVAEGLGHERGDLEIVEWMHDGKIAAAEVIEWFQQGRGALVTFLRGTGSSVCVRARTRGQLHSNAICTSYDPPEVSSVSPNVAFAGDTNGSWTICGRNLGLVERQMELTVQIGGVQCKAVLILSDGCVICETLQFVSNEWLEGEPLVKVNSSGLIGTLVDAEALLLEPAPTISVITPETAGPGDPILLTGRGFGLVGAGVRSVEVGGIFCEDLVWISSTAIQCTIPDPHPIWVTAQTNDRIVPYVEIVVTSDAGIRGVPASIVPAGLRLRPNPQSIARGIISWRKTGLSETLHVRWRYPSILLEEAEMQTVDGVRPQVANSFVVQAVGIDNKEVGVEVVSRDEVRTTSASFVPPHSPLNRTDSNVLSPPATFYDTYETTVIVPRTSRVRARIFAKSNDGWGLASVEQGDGVTEACVQSEYLDTSRPLQHQSCTPCPLEAECGGLSRENVTARQGFWRLEWEEDGLSFAACLQEGACLGYSLDFGKQLLSRPDPIPSYLQNGTENKTWVESWVQKDVEALISSQAIPNLRLIREDIEGCSKWHRGVLCDACKAGSYPGIGGGCTECGSATWVAGRMALLVSVIGTGLTVLLFRAWNNRDKSRSMEMMIAKLLLTHLQTISVIGSIDLRWPTAVRGFFDVVDTSSTATASGLAVECLMGKGAEDPFARTGITYSAPFWLLGFTVIVWGVVELVAARQRRLDTRSRPQRRRTIIAVDESHEVGSVQNFWCLSWIAHEWRKTWDLFDWQKYREQLFISSVVLLFLLHTPISKAAIRVMTCRRVGPDNVYDVNDDRFRLLLQMDMGLKCEGDTVNRMLWMGIPIVLVFSIGLPIAVGVYLWRLGPQRLYEDSNLRSRLGFLYLGYNPNYPFWESVTALRKVLLAVVTVLLGPSGGGMQALTALLMVLLALILHTWAKPYDNAALNNLELLALIAAAISLICGVYVVFDDLGGGFGSNTMSILASLTIIGVNVALIVAAVLTLNFAIRERFRAMRGRLGSVVGWCLGPIFVRQQKLRTTPPTSQTRTSAGHLEDRSTQPAAPLEEMRSSSMSQINPLASTRSLGISSTRSIIDAGVELT